MIYLIIPGKPSEQLKKMVKAALENKEYIAIHNPEDIPHLRNKKILFAIELDMAGINIPLMEIMKNISSRGKDAFWGTTGALLIRSSTELYTKSMASHIIFWANQLGCSFIGHPLVEATGNLKNFKTWQKSMPLSLQEISLELSSQLGNRLEKYRPIRFENPKIAYLHSSSRKTSNTLSLWNMVEANLKDFKKEELYIENGAVFDCFGCSFKACVEYGKKNSCYYGGVMTEKIIPSIETADILLWICPNYNDSISSNLMAVINRLTTLYRRMSFHNRIFFSLIVSGNSGSDSIAKQLIDALNINKGFYLPPYFCLMEIANDKGSILKVPDIDKKAYLFAKHIRNQTLLS